VLSFSYTGTNKSRKQDSDLLERGS